MRTSGYLLMAIAAALFAAPAAAVAEDDAVPLSWRNPPLESVLLRAATQRKKVLVYVLSEH